ncbi:TIGR04290 family methyltransferase [Autumnicola edwardsiae]|uniref:TIGR04290 family methyltransferase n=1 Tax=Autumnicola edwardsiae TaxID=3075594 RepID=A0ABU3CZQ6_9FLAO|nr:TIGR04290 family methyltransferase [Zunongwangia sp. F297]MDT0651748.1 TIGR04290 family methyltransferase [Zunongwangia sp. F297]
MSTETEIKQLEPWFHNIHLPDGNQTATNHFLGDFPAFKWKNIKDAIPEDLTGWKVLDIGCNAGFYSIELAKRGAEVTGIDLDEHYLKQARWTAKQFGLEDQITFKQMQVYDFAHSEEKFDLVWFMGVFYHLRYPLLAMDILSQKTTRMMVFQTLSLPGKEEMGVPEDVEFHKREIMKTDAWPKMAFIENKLAGDPTNWWAPNHQGIISMLRSCGFKVTAMPEDETYIAEKDEELKSTLETWNFSEYLSAVGKDWKKEVEKKTKK